MHSSSGICINWLCRVYAICALYLLVCAFWLTGNAFAGIPKQLEQEHSIGQIVLTLVEPPVGALIAAMISTFGIYIIASLLYVCPSVHYIGDGLTDDSPSATHGTWFRLSPSICCSRPVS